jgi:hypothetical protein
MCLSAGCGPKKAEFTLGERVIATLDGVATGTITQVEWGQDPKYPKEPYYEIDFGLLPNGESDAIWFPRKFLKPCR